MSIMSISISSNQSSWLGLDKGEDILFNRHTKFGYGLVTFLSNSIINVYTCPSNKKRAKRKLSKRMVRYFSQKVSLLNLKCTSIYLDSMLAVKKEFKLEIKIIAMK